MPIHPVATSDRLIQLLIKVMIGNECVNLRYPDNRISIIANIFDQGLLYESCVDFCQSKAMTNDKGLAVGGGSVIGRPPTNASTDSQIRFSQLLHDNQLSESDLSLISWLRSIPNNVFGCPFQRRSLRVDIEPLPKPQKTLMNVSIMDSASDLLSRYDFKFIHEKFLNSFITVACVSNCQAVWCLVWYKVTIKFIF